MQVSLLPNYASSVPVSDTERMKKVLKSITKCLEEIDERRATAASYSSILASIQELCTLVDLVDNANDFYKIGGFYVLPALLDMSHDEIKAASSELIAELVQNNVYCQRKVLETTLAEELVYLLDKDKNATVCTKALYALSCLCRNNREAAIRLEEMDGVPVLLKIIQQPNERLQAKVAFFLSDLVVNEPRIRDTLYSMGFVQKLAYLIKENTSASQEQLLQALLTLVEHHNPSKELCTNLFFLRSILDRKLEQYAERPEHQESRDYCVRLLNLCFNIPLM